MVALAAAACSGDDDTDGNGATPEAAADSTIPSVTTDAAERTTGSGPPADPTVGDGYTISAATAETANACFDIWHSVRTSAVATLTYQAQDVEAVVAVCADADAQLDEDNRTAPDEPLPAHALSAVIGQVLVAASKEMLTARERCAAAPNCGPEELTGFLVLSRSEADAFSGEPETAPTVDEIDGLIIL